MVRLETTTDTVEQVKEAIGEIAEADDLIGEVKPKSVESDDSESGAASDADDEKVEAQKGDPDDADIPKGLKITLGKLRQDRRELRDKNRELNDRLNKLEAKEAPVVPAKVAPVSVKPTRAQFADAEDPDEAYIEALTEFKAKEQRAVDVKAREDAAMAEAHEKNVAAYTELLPVAHERYEDFDETFAELDDDLPATPIMQHVMLSSNVGPDIGYYLAKNPKIAERIGKLDPAGQLREMGKVEQKVEDIVEALEAKKKLEAKDEDADKEPPKKITKAPLPTTPLKALSPALKKSKTEEDEERHVDHITFDRSYEKTRQEHRKNRV